MKEHSSCQCGACEFEIKGEPLSRFVCHCEVCQRYTQSDFSDVTIYRMEDVKVIKGSDNMDLKPYKAPPAIQRGICQTCNQPSIEFLQLPLLPGLAMVPSYNIADSDPKMEPELHAFYHRRTQNVEDSLPKYSGYLKSQLVMGKKVLAGLLKSRS